MKKWPVTLSTTEPFNYIGIVNVRNGNINSEILEATITENGTPVDLTGCKVTIQTIINNFPVERACTVTSAINGKVEYVFDQYTMQKVGKQIANLQISKGDDTVNATQNFAYFVINAVSKTPGEMGSYWQSIFDLIRDMTDYLNSNKQDFEEWMNHEESAFDIWRTEQKENYLVWFSSVQEILESIDPGGKMLAELIRARNDINGITHTSISERLDADMTNILTILLENHYTLNSQTVSLTGILQDDHFSENHSVVKVGEIEAQKTKGALMIGTIDDSVQGVFKLVKVGEQ